MYISDACWWKPSRLFKFPSDCSNLFMSVISPSWALKMEKWLLGSFNRTNCMRHWFRMLLTCTGTLTVPSWCLMSNTWILNHATKAQWVTGLNTSSVNPSAAILTCVLPQRPLWASATIPQWRNVCAGPCRGSRGVTKTRLPVSLVRDSKDWHHGMEVPACLESGLNEERHKHFQTFRWMKYDRKTMVCQNTAGFNKQWSKFFKSLEVNTQFIRVENWLYVKAKDWFIISGWPQI